MRKKYIKRKTVVIILTMVLMMLATPVMSVMASTATRERHRQLEQQLRETRQSVREQQNLLTGTRHEMSQLVAEMQDLDQQMMDAAMALESIELSLLATEIRQADAAAALAEAHAEADAHMEVLHSRLRVMHEQGNIGLIDVLFQAQSITDFLMRWEHVRAVTQFDRDMFASIEATEARILANIEDLARAQNLMEELQIQEQFALENLGFALLEREEWFERLAEDEAAMAELLAIFEEEQRRAETDFANIQAQLQREQSEMARAAANAQRAAALERLNNFDGQFMWPIPTHSMSNNPGARFGMRMHPILRQYRMHSGIDVGAPTGTRLYAAADGVVRFAGWSGGYGNTVIIDHGNGYSTLYAHNSRNRVVAGQEVTRGQHIADVGSTGMSTGPHLHFEIRINNRAVDPLLYFQ